MNLYRLSLMIHKKSDLLGLSEDEMTLIQAMHKATDKTYAECFIELIKTDWHLYEAVTNVLTAQENA
jgi:hypothetical protein